MELHKLAQEIRKEFDSIKVQYPVTDHIDLKDPVNRDYLLFCEELNIALTACEDTKKGEVTAENVKPLLDVLSRHGRRVHDSRGVWNHHWTTPANQLAKKVGSLLSNVIQKFNKQSSIELMMPAVKSTKSNWTTNLITRLNPWEWIVGEDGAPIEIEPCLHRAQLTGKYLSTAEAEGSQRELTAAEIARLTNHSAAVRAYVATFAGTDEASKKRLHDELITALKNPNYVVEDIYGADGNQRLEQNVFNDFLSQFQQIPGSSRFMAHVPVEMIKARVVGPKPNPDKVARLDKKTKLDDYLVEYLRDFSADDLFTGDFAHDRATLLCLAELYRRDLVARPAETNNTLGIGYTRAQKLLSVTVLRDFILSSEPLEQFSDYVRVKGMEDYRKALYDKGYIWNSTLCNLVLLTEALGKRYNLHNMTLSLQGVKSGEGAVVDAATAADKAVSSSAPSTVPPVPAAASAAAATTLPEPSTVSATASNSGRTSPRP